MLEEAMECGIKHGNCLGDCLEILKAEVKRLEAELAEAREGIPHLGLLRRAMVAEAEVTRLTAKLEAANNRGMSALPPDVSGVVNAALRLDRSWNSDGECGNCDSWILRRALIDYLQAVTTTPAALTGKEK